MLSHYYVACWICGPSVSNAVYWVELQDMHENRREKCVLASIKYIWEAICWNASHQTNADLIKSAADWTSLEIGLFCLQNTDNWIHKIACVSLTVDSWLQFEVVCDQFARIVPCNKNKRNIVCATNNFGNEKTNYLFDFSWLSH